MKRKDFIVGCTAGLAMLAAPRLSLFARAPEEEDDHCFVVLFLRGGCDGLQLVGPTSDSIYQDFRPESLKVVNYGRSEGLLLDKGLSGVGFRLHSNAPELNEFYQGGEMAILHGCGLTNGTRSHFEAMALIERGLESSGTSRDGWMARFLKESSPAGKLPAVATSGGLPTSFSGFQSTTSISSLERFGLIEGYKYPDLLRKWYSGNNQMDVTARETLKTLDLLANTKKVINPAARYPKEWYTEELNGHFQTLAQLIKEDFGVRMAMVDYGGWDTHEHQERHFPRLVSGLSGPLAAFYRDLGNKRKKVTILVMSEFGRRLRSNRSGGTDHGYGNMMMVLGEGVNGGRMYGDWPGLRQDNLDRGVDLAITTDYRAVLSEILLDRMGLKKVDPIFPGFKMPDKLGFLG